MKKIYYFKTKHCDHQMQTRRVYILHKIENVKATPKTAKMFIKLCLILVACLQTTGCLLTRAVEEMNTHEIIGYHATEVYPLKDNMIILRHDASNKKYDPLYNLWVTKDVLYSEHGTRNNKSYYISYGNSSEPTKKYLTDPEALSHYYPYPVFPKCDISISHYDSYGSNYNFVENLKPYKVAYKFDVNKTKPIIFSDESKLCDGVSLLPVHKDNYMIYIYIKDGNSNSELKYKQYIVRDIEFTRKGDVEAHKVIFKYTLMPFAVVGDVITSPIQLFLVATTPYGPGR